MSVYVMNWVFQHSTSRGTDRLVLLAIADATNDHGSAAWPSLSTIGRKAGIDRRTVSRSIAKLEEIGELRKVRHGGRAGVGGTSNAYEIVMSKPQEEGQDATTKEGVSATSGEMPLGASCPEVGATRPQVVASRPPIHPNHPNHPKRGDDDSDALPPEVIDLGIARARQIASGLAVGAGATSADEGGR